MNDQKIVCAACEDEKYEEDIIIANNGITYCSDCWGERFFICDNCGIERRQEDYHAHGECDFCQDEDDNVRPHSRDYSLDDLPAFQSATKGKIITSHRIFSAEIECYAPSSEAMRALETGLPRAFGISEDGSLGDNGVEFQTPKLKGKKGEETMRLITGLLKEHAYTVEDDCGLHIHLDGEGFEMNKNPMEVPKALKSLLEFYLVYENVMLSFLPKSRRGNRYCCNLDVSLAALQRVTSLRQLEKLWYRTESDATIERCKPDKWHTSRYYGINFHSLIGRGHLEVRYHSGTINGTKILNWVALHQKIMDMAVSGTLSNDVAALSPVESFFDILQLPKPIEDYFRARRAKFSEAAPWAESCVLTDDESTVCAE